VSESESGESEIADVEEEEVGAPNKNKVSRKGKDKPNRRNIQAERRSDATDTAGKLEAATSDGKRKAPNV